jgi:hypothetical protein
MVGLITTKFSSYFALAFLWNIPVLLFYGVVPMAALFFASFIQFEVLYYLPAEGVESFLEGAALERVVFLFRAAAAKRFEVFLNLSAGGSMAPFSYLERFSSRSFLTLPMFLKEERGILE